MKYNSFAYLRSEKGIIKQIYTIIANTIVGNCDSLILLEGKEKTTFIQLSKTIGKGTIYL